MWRSKRVRVVEAPCPSSVVRPTKSFSTGQYFHDRHLAQQPGPDCWRGEPRCRIPRFQMFGVKVSVLFKPLSLVKPDLLMHLTEQYGRM